MSMEMAWHFDCEKAKLQVLISHLGSLPFTRAGARAGEQQLIWPGLRHGAETWVTPQWLILVLLTNKKVLTRLHPMVCNLEM